MGCGSSSNAASGQESRDQPQSQQQSRDQPQSQPQQQSRDDVAAQPKEDKVKADKGSDDAFIQESLTSHNNYRKKHGAPPLTHAPDLTAIAQKWADKLVALGNMKHSSPEERQGAGENLYYAWSSAGAKATGHEAVDSWYDEIKDYDFDNGRFAMGTGHFTQVVWEETRELGVAKAFSADGKTVFVVANYRPAGNMLGNFDNNVKPLQ